MKHDDLRRESSPDAPKKPRILVPLLLGSLVLHGLIWWVAARFPAPPARAPQTLTEVQLSELPSPPAKTPQPQATPATKPEPPRLALSPRAPQPAAPRRASSNPPLQLPEQQAAPTAPLVRSERAVAQTGVVAKKPNRKKPLVPRPTAAPQTQTPAPIPLPDSPSAPDDILPQPRDPKPTTATQPEKPAPLPTPRKGQRQRDEGRGSVDSNPGSDVATGEENEKGSDAGSGSTTGKGSGPNAAKGSDDGPAKGSISKSATSRKDAASKQDVASKKDAVSRKDAASNRDAASRKDDASRKDGASSKGGGGLFGLGSGPFGIGGGAGQGPRPNQTRSDTPSPLAGAGQGQSQGAKGEILGSDDGNTAGGQSGAGGGPFGIGGAAGEGPRRIIYMLDISYSMEPRFERAKQELRAALSGLQPGESFNIIGVYGNVTPFQPKLVEATPRNIDKGRAFIDALRPKRYTNLEIAFETAFAASGVNVVVLITDGVPTYGLGSPDFSEGGKPDIGANFGELARRVRQLNRTGARIYTVGLADQKDGEFEAAALLQRIARENGGSFKTVRIDAKTASNSP